MYKKLLFLFFLFNNYSIFAGNDGPAAEDWARFCRFARENKASKRVASICDSVRTKLNRFLEDALQLKHPEEKLAFFALIAAVIVGSFLFKFGSKFIPRHRLSTTPVASQPPTSSLSSSTQTSQKNAMRQLLHSKLAERGQIKSEEENDFISIRIFFNFLKGIPGATPASTTRSSSGGDPRAAVADSPVAEDPGVGQGGAPAAQPSEPQPSLPLTEPIIKREWDFRFSEWKPLKFSKKKYNESTERFDYFDREDKIWNKYWSRWQPPPSLCPKETIHFFQASTKGDCPWLNESEILRIPRLRSYEAFKDA